MQIGTLANRLTGSPFTISYDSDDFDDEFLRKLDEETTKQRGKNLKAEALGKAFGRENVKV